MAPTVPFAILIKKAKYQLRVDVIPRKNIAGSKSFFELVIEHKRAGSICCNNGKWESDDITDVAFIRLVGSYIERISRLMDKKDVLNILHSFSLN
jgi:hypothetical protein